MNMVYRDDKLFVELFGEISEKEILIMKERLFSVLDCYYIKDVVINVNCMFGLKKDLFNNFLNDYHSKFNGNIMIVNK